MNGLEVKNAYEDSRHLQECQLRYITEEQAKTSSYGCTCERKKLIAELTAELLTEDLRAVKAAGGIKVLLQLLPVGW